MMRAASLFRLSPLLALALLLGALALFHAVPAEAGHTIATPTNLQAQAGDGQVTLTWATGGGNHNAYQVAHGEHPSGTLSTQTVAGNAGRTVTITGLTGGTTYRFRVRAQAHSGHSASAWTDFVTATPTAPVTVWSATLTVDQANLVYFGCDNNDPDQDDCSTATVLTEDEFTHGGSTRTVTALYWRSTTDRLFFVVDFSDSAATKTALNSFTLYVDGTALAISDAATGRLGEAPITWSYNPATDWTDGQMVSLSLTRTAASDADLSGLTASTSTSASGTFSALTLSPSTFVAATTAYTASVANSITHVKITPTTNDSNATVEVGKGSSLSSVTSGSASAAIPLSVGANAITVKVTAEDGSTTKTYTVTVTRAQAQQSSDADLSALTASTSTSASGTFSALTLSPSTFAAATTAYTASVANDRTHVKITPTVAESNATVEVGKGSSLATVTSGSASTAISLQVGANAITVKVTAQDGSTTKTYTVTVTREEAQAQNHPAPTGLRVASGAEQLDVSWNPPPASVGTVGAYAVEFTSASSATVANGQVALQNQIDPAAGWVVSLASADASTTPSHTITGLAGGVAYRVRVSYYLSDLTASDWVYATATPVGPDVSDWQPTLFVQGMGEDRYGCDDDFTIHKAPPGRAGGAECSKPANFGGNEFSVSNVRFGTRGYRVLDLYIEPDRRTSWGETAYRVVFRVDDDSGTAELGRGMTLVLSTPGVAEKRLPFNTARRDGNTFTWSMFFDDGDLGWGHRVRGVKVRIHQFTAGLDYVRVHYDEMRDGQPVDGFGAWRPAGVSAYFDAGLVAYIPGQFPSSDPEQGMLTTTHAKLWVGASHSGSTLEWAEGNVNGATGNFTALAAHELTPAIELNPASKWTYVYIRVTNGSQVATHTIAIDPPPRTYTLTPKARVAEGEAASLTLSLGSPATAGGVSFTVSADYPDGGATAEDVGQFATSVTVPEGQQSVRIIIPTVDDEAIEEDQERFTVRVAHVGEPAWAVDPEGTDAAVVTIEDNDEPPEGPEPWDIKVVPGDGTLTVTWNIGSRDGVEDSDIWHVLRWSQEFGVWANPRDPRAVGKNDGLSVDPGLTSYTITDLKNGVATGVFIRSMVGHRNNMSEREGKSSEWVRTKGEHTTPVAPPNDAPTVSSAIADATIDNESGTHEVSLSGVFADADNDDLTVTTSSSDENVATVSVSDDYSTLTVSAKSRGTANITATASDGNDGEVSDTFAVTVKSAPVASSIADVSALEVDATHEVSLSGVFSDADEDSLTITAASSDEGKATVSVSADQSTLTVSGASEGTATITVTAQDTDGNTVSGAFDVTVNAPAQPEPVEPQPVESEPEQEPQQQQLAVQLPGAVTNLTVEPRNTNITVSWEAPTDGGTPTGYIAHIKPVGGGNGHTLTPNADKTTVKFRRLDRATEYRIWVRAVNEEGKGERTPIHAATK